MHDSLCSHLMDLIQNAVEAGAHHIRVRWCETGDVLRLVVRDDGRGMTATQVAQALDPFVSEPGKHPARRVGLGLPFLRQAAAAAGGCVRIRSARGRGTTVRCRLARRHPDCPADGDVPGTLLQAMNLAGAVQLIWERRRDGAAYRVASQELVAAVGALNEPAALHLAREYVAGLENDLMEGRNETCPS